MKVDYKKLYPEWDNSANFCGANRYVVGDEGDDFDAWNNIQVYKSLRDGVYVLDQPFATSDLHVLIKQLEKIIGKLYGYLEERGETI